MGSKVGDFSQSLSWCFAFPFETVNSRDDDNIVGRGRGLERFPRSRLGRRVVEGMGCDKIAVEVDSE